MIDRSDFTPEQEALWAKMFPLGIEHGANEQNSPNIRLYSFGYICMLELGAVPESVTKELGDTPRLVNEYMENVRRGRRK